MTHYPRLAVFSFTLGLPYRESMADYRSLFLRFHTEVWQRTVHTHGTSAGHARIHRHAATLDMGVCQCA
ncbi:hypothetical protein [Enterobacter ludwigii]|uniref:hypothetical protein n=1 Tax=Enterobacter ludwigii TaxID=299767 RepID=UPI000417B5BA|nr:hypothetical protein [Enterobacter ludwigii]